MQSPFLILLARVKCKLILLLDVPLSSIGSADYCAITLVSMGCWLRRDYDYMVSVLDNVDLSFLTKEKEGQKG